jgi:NADH-quinone oxidoreductase subunit J
MTAQQILFYLMAALAVGCAIGVVAFRHPIHSAFSLIGALFFLAGIFVLLDAHFVAAIQVLVYAGAVMVLFMFVIMLLNLSTEELGPARITATKILGILLLGAVGVAMVRTLLEQGSRVSFAKVDVETFGTVEHVGKLLFTRYLFPFEIVSVLLIAAIVGAVVIGKKRL